MKKTDIIPIESTAASIWHNGSDYYYIRHIFTALVEHKELLEKTDYKRLYDEAIDYLFRRASAWRDWDESRREWGYGWFEFLAELQNNDKNIEKFSIETVNAFLAERRKAWNI